MRAAGRLDVNGVAQINNNVMLSGTLQVGSVTAAGHRLEVQGYAKFASGIGTFGDPVAGYALYANGPSWTYFGGNVGILTTNPSYNLHVNGTLGVGSNATLSGLVGIGMAPSGGYWFEVNGNGRFYGGMYSDTSVDTNTLNVRSSATLLGALTVNGQTRINNILAVGMAPSGSYWFEVNGGACFYGGISVNGIYGINMYGANLSGGTYWTYGLQGNPGYNNIRMMFVHVTGVWAGIRFETDATGNTYDFQSSNGSAYASGGNWVNATSDRRVKTEIVPIDAPLERLGQLQGCHYRRLDRPPVAGFPAPNPYEYGLIAQDVADALPEAAFEHDYGDAGVLWNYTERPILALLVESVKALVARVAVLESRP